MSNLRDLIVRWQCGWSVARALPVAEDVGGALRVRCMQPGRDIEYVALDADEDLASLTTLAELVAGDGDDWRSVASSRVMWAEYWAWGEEALGDIPLLVPTGGTDTGDEIIAHQHRRVRAAPA